MQVSSITFNTDNGLHGLNNQDNQAQGLNKTKSPDKANGGEGIDSSQLLQMVEQMLQMLLQMLQGAQQGGGPSGGGSENSGTQPTPKGFGGGDQAGPGQVGQLLQSLGDLTSQLGEMLTGGQGGGFGGGEVRV
jgi:hypothetical protein